MSKMIKEVLDRGENIPFGVDSSYVIMDGGNSNFTSGTLNESLGILYNRPNGWTLETIGNNDYISYNGGFQTKDATLANFNADGSIIIAPGYGLIIGSRQTEETANIDTIINGKQKNSLEIGSNVIAAGNDKTNSLIVGKDNITNYSNTVVGGIGLTAPADGSIVFGQYNDTNDKFINYKYLDSFTNDTKWDDYEIEDSNSDQGKQIFSIGVGGSSSDLKNLITGFNSNKLNINGDTNFNSSIRIGKNIYCASDLYTNNLHVLGDTTVELDNSKLTDMITNLNIDTDEDGKYSLAEILTALNNKIDNKNVDSTDPYKIFYTHIEASKQQIKKSTDTDYSDLATSGNWWDNYWIDDRASESTKRYHIEYSATQNGVSKTAPLKYYNTDIKSTVQKISYYNKTGQQTVSWYFPGTGFPIQNPIMDIYYNGFTGILDYTITFSVLNQLGYTLDSDEVLFDFNLSSLAGLSSIEINKDKKIPVNCFWENGKAKNAKTRFKSVFEGFYTIVEEVSTTTNGVTTTENRLRLKYGPGSIAEGQNYLGRSTAYSVGGTTVQTLLTTVFKSFSSGYCIDDYKLTFTLSGSHKIGYGLYSSDSTSFELIKIK